MQIIPIGMSGNCLEIFDALAAEAGIPAILDDGAHPDGRAFDGTPILPIASWRDFPKARFLCLIGSPISYLMRGDLIRRHKIPTDRFSTFCHPSTEISGQASIGRGVVFYSGALVTSRAHIADHILVMPKAVVHHDVSIGNYSIIGTGVILAGGVTVGESCYIGSGSVIRNDISVGSGALVGIGFVVTKDVPPGAVVAGNPARQLEVRSSKSG